MLERERSTLTRIKTDGVERGPELLRAQPNYVRR